MEIKQHIVLATPPTITHRTAEENLGIGYLAAILRRHGVRVTIIDAWLEGLDVEQLVKRISELESPLWIGFSCYSFNIRFAVQTMKLLREYGFSMPIVAGGYGPTFHAQKFLDEGFDYALRGEGESSVLALTHKLSQGLKDYEIPGASYIFDNTVRHDRATPYSDNLDEYPFPERDTLDMAIQRKSPAHLSTARGCTGFCKFCSVTAFQIRAAAPRWRMRGIKSIVAELKSLQERGVRHVKIVDDSFLEPPRDAVWCSKLADEMEREGIKVNFWAYVRADRIDPQILCQLDRLGFVAFFFGIESFSQSALNRWNKPASVKDNHQALEMLSKYDFVVQAGFILFDIETTIEEVEENYAAFRKYLWLVTKGAFTELYAAEGTVATARLKRQGQVTPESFIGQNYSYEIKDPIVRAIYKTMRQWHIAHQPIYDKAIDPLSAPKTLVRDEMRLFEPLIRELREMDLDFMEKAIEISKQTNGSLIEMENLAKERIQQTSCIYDRIDADLNNIYTSVGLIYDADRNPFIR